MSDSFYSLSGETLYFSSGATELLYSTLVVLEEERQHLSPDEQAVVSWLRDPWCGEQGALRAFNMHNLPDALAAPERRIAFLSMLERFADRLTVEKPTIPDPESVSERNTLWDDSCDRWRWLAKTLKLHEFIRETLSSDTRPAPFSLKASARDLLGVEFAQLTQERQRLEKNSSTSEAALKNLLARQIRLKEKLDALSPQGE